MGIDVHYQATIPDNVIRIETLDESDEFIEIVLPPTLQIDDPPLEDMSAMFIPALRGIGSAIKGVKGVTELSRSLTREEVLEVVGRLPTAKELGLGRSERVHYTKDTKEFNELVTKFINNAKYNGEHKQTMRVKKTGKEEKVNVLEYLLDDGTSIGIRSNSQTGGRAIDINKKEKIIHNLETMRK